MIGVVAHSAEHDAVREFFELFKTPWEFYRDGQRYDVLLCTGKCEAVESATLVILYAGREIEFDRDHNVQTSPRSKKACNLSYKHSLIPISGDAVRFIGKRGLLKDVASHECVAYLQVSRNVTVARIGYDLFEEVRTLLTTGQRASRAGVPTLELHIAFLRDLITGCELPLVEVPPVPDGYTFITCLTHDVDNPLIRRHRWDHTMFGFLYRAIFSSFFKLLHRRISFRTLVTNWAAALKLPLVYLGVARDFWGEFDSAYLELENDIPSTFFVIPFSDQPGKTSTGAAPSFRAARYNARDLADSIQRLLAAGREVSLHGIDAWFDSTSGSQELEEVRNLTGIRNIGVRMHWLYYNCRSPVALEDAGAAYDATVGYNETVGYRAGTMQAYKPLAAGRLLELPLHVMDTALFYPEYLGLSQAEALPLIRQFANDAMQFGGCLTFNWHDRSLAPERKWDECYRFLLEELKSRGTWFSTAGQAVSWFRKRRSVTFEVNRFDPEAVSARVSCDEPDLVPGLRLRIYKPRTSRNDGAAARDYIDLAFNDSIHTRLPCGTQLLKGMEDSQCMSDERARRCGNRLSSETDMEQQPEQDSFLVAPGDRILITGAAGFIGSRVVQNLVDRGFKNLVCFVRPSSDLGVLDAIMRNLPVGTTIEVVKGNLLSSGDCEAACKGVTGLFHVAAGIGEKSFPDAFANSVVATRNLLEASLKCAQLQRFVLVSSFTVYTNRQKRRLLDESCPVDQEPELRGEAYCYAKVRQEQIVAEYGEKHGVPYVIIRPGSVYGPRTAEFTGRVGIGTFGLFLHLGGSNTIPFTYVDNCADAVVLAGLVRGINGEVFNVVDDDLPSSRTFLRQYKAGVKRFRSIYLPHPLSYALCYLWERYSSWSHGQLPPVFNRRRWYADWKKTRYSNQKLKTKLGWVPHVSTQEGLCRYFAACAQSENNA